VFTNNINDNWGNLKDCTNVKDIENMHCVTWEQLAEPEPELTESLTFARMVGNGCRKWRDVERGFNQFKKDVVKLVGFSGKHGGHPVLGRAAYEVTCWKLHNAVAQASRLTRLETETSGATLFTAPGVSAFVHAVSTAVNSTCHPPTQPHVLLRDSDIRVTHRRHQADRQVRRPRTAEDRRTLRQPQSRRCRTRLRCG